MLGLDSSKKEWTTDRIKSKLIIWKVSHLVHYLLLQATCSREILPLDNWRMK